MLRVYLDKNVFTALRYGTDEQIFRLKSLLENNKDVLFVPFSKAHIDDLMNDQTDEKKNDAEFMEHFCSNYYFFYDHIKHSIKYLLAKPSEVLNDQTASMPSAFSNILDFFE